MIAFVVVAQLAISGTPAAITIFVEKPTIQRKTRDETRRPQVHVERFMFPFRDSLPSLKGLYFENITVLGQFCAEGFT